jgi:molybdate transport system regulatory protein
MYEYRLMKLHVRIMLANERGEEFMGAGLLQLLNNIERRRSIAQAARAMSLSYVKALRILARLERNLGRDLVRRQKGGAAHGGTELTPAGRRFVRDFKQLHDGATRLAQRRFEPFRKKYGRKK